MGSSFADNLLDILGIAEYVNVKKDFDRMEKRINKYKNKFAEKRQDTFIRLFAKCPDGTERLTKQMQRNYWDEMQTKIWPEENELAEKYDNYLKEYKKKLAWSVTTFAATFALGKLMKTARFANSKLNQAFQKTLVKGTSAETSAETLSGLIGTVSSSAIDGLDKIFAYKDFNAIKDKALSWSSKKYKKIIKKYTDLNQRIENAYKSCIKKEENTPEHQNDTDGKQETFVENKDDNTVTFTTPPVQPILDPSGYVYEAVLSNRLPGVTTTVYQKQQGNALKWNADDYSQENPLVTDEAGFYRWDVPMGEWQVKYEKEGYETCYSDWLPVPPPQLDVNIGMKQTTPPAVKKMRGVESGITIELSKYMLPESLNENTIVVGKDGMSQSGRVELLNSEQSPTGDASYVSKVKFVPEDRFHAGDEVLVKVKKDVESYCSVKMGTDHTEIVVIEPEITAIVIDSVLTVPYDSTRTVQVLVMPKEVSAGKVLKAHLSSNLIASINEELITIDENGLATFELGGELPGSALLTLTLDNTDISAQSKVKVDMEYETVSTPTASIRNGSEVEIGTLLSLSCATPGATIYYTLDGSCPCNEDTRILYTEPFVLPEGVVMVKVIAVEDYLYDSDVATFIYEVKEPSGIKARTESEHSFNVSYANGMIVIENVEGGSCMIYDMAGRELSGRTRLLARDTVPVTKADVYVVCVRFADGSAAVRKIVRH